jgi:hypothetical protein
LICRILLKNMHSKPLLFAEYYEKKHIPIRLDLRNIL